MRLSTGKKAAVSAAAVVTLVTCAAYVWLIRETLVAHHAAGVVVSKVSLDDSEHDDPTIMSTINFVTKDGRFVSFQQSDIDTPVGLKIAVSYGPDNRLDAHVDTIEHWLWPATGFAIAIVMMSGVFRNRDDSFSPPKVITSSSSYKNTKRRPLIRYKPWTSKASLARRFKPIRHEANRTSGKVKRPGAVGPAP